MISDPGGEAQWADGPSKVKQHRSIGEEILLFILP